MSDVQIPATTQRVLGFTTAAAAAAAAGGWLEQTFMRSGSPRRLSLDAHLFKAGPSTTTSADVQRAAEAEAPAEAQVYGLQCSRCTPATPCAKNCIALHCKSEAMLGLGFRV